MTLLSSAAAFGDDAGAAPAAPPPLPPPPLPPSLLSSESELSVPVAMRSTSSMRPLLPRMSSWRRAPHVQLLMRRGATG